MPRMPQLAEAWRQRAVDGFRAAYRKAMRGCAGVSGEQDCRAKALIDFFTLEKAVYEVYYELANRPGWVSIPLDRHPPHARQGRAGTSVGGRRMPDRPSAEVEAIVEARHGDPFAFLGMHQSSAGIYVRTMSARRRGAWRSSKAATGEIAARGERIHPAGLFVASMADRQEPFRYRLRVRWGGHEQEFDDVYRFRAGARRARPPSAGRGQPSRELSEARRAPDRA